jgi:cytochrome c biogenesis protein CcmG, thiol:disulfide interchange protein DsbE
LANIEYQSCVIHSPLSILHLLRGREMPVRRLIITLAVIGPILALLAWGFTRDAKYIKSPLLAKPATPFTVTLYDGKKITLEDLRGKAVFLNFWASWCEPCRAEAKDIEAAWQKVKDKNMVFLGVALQDLDDNAKGFLQEFKITYPNGRDESEKIGVDYGTWGIPESFFIDPQGRITYKHVGGIRAALVLTKIEEAAKGIASAQEGRGDYQGVR